jgi:hypothetical protein
VYDNFDPEEKVVYRVPAYGRPQGAEVESMIKAMGIVLQGDRIADRPLEHLSFLGPERERMTVLDQAVGRGRDANRDWLEYRLTVQDAGTAVRLQMVFRVDAETKLPASCRIESGQDGRPPSFEIQFDYPERGPADIYDLGVPRMTKLVDRVPEGDLKRILDTLQAGRERMDDYRAVFVTESGAVVDARWTALPTVFYRKGLRFRADYVSGWDGDIAKTEPPAEAADLRKWWLERTKFFRFYTHYVIRDSSLYTAVTRPVSNPDGRQGTEIASFDRTDFAARPEEMIPPEYSMRPEFACRPPLGIGSPHLEPVLDLHPAGGPEGTILLTVRNSPNRNPLNEKGIGSPDGFRYWLDPKRDYIVVKWRTARRDASGQEVLVEEDTVEETARSPQGVWYATRIRRSFGGKYQGQVYHIYVDFDVKLPDSLFEIPKPGKVP